MVPSENCLVFAESEVFSKIYPIDFDGKFEDTFDRDFILLFIELY